MILFEITENEQDPTYQELEVANGNRQYDFLLSLVTTALAVKRPFLSSHIIKALNFQAITCLHAYAGEYRPCRVEVGKYIPPDHYRVQALMDDFVNTVNVNWTSSDAVTLAAFVLWRLNHIHPFINGNGRTARASCYFVLCVRAGGWLPGKTILPELIRRNRPAYVAALGEVDQSLAKGALNLKPLQDLLSSLLEDQLASANGADGAEVPPAETPPDPA